jgi:hypothetical protein
MNNGVPGAAVIGSSVVSFADCLSAQDREDIYLSNMFAQFATRSAYKDGLVGSNWFDYYKNQLKFLGWDNLVPVSPGEPEGGVMGDASVRKISQVFGEEFSTPTTLALDALRCNNRTLNIFEEASLSGNRGFFQIIPCVPKGKGKVEIGVYHKQFSTRKEVSRFLFWPVEQTIQTAEEQMAIITFSTLHHAAFRDKVLKKLTSGAIRNIHALEI